MSATLRDGRLHRGRRSMLALGVCVVAGLAAGCSSRSTEAVTAGSTVTTVAAAPVVLDAPTARYEALRAPPGRRVGRAANTVVDDVVLRSSVRVQTPSGSRLVRSARRIRITGGPFPYGDARVLVLIDGRSVGEGQVGDHGRTLSVAVLDAAQAHAGAVIGYRIGSRRAVTVGALRAGG